jgi:hypothetical protein
MLSQKNGLKFNNLIRSLSRQEKTLMDRICFFFVDGQQKFD